MSPHRPKMSRVSTRVLGTCVALLAAAVACGCNALVETVSDQCETLADCVQKGPNFANTYCSAEKICTSAPLRCTTSGECSKRFGEPGWCRPDGICTPVLSAECREVVPQGALSEDEVILAGFMGPVRGPFASHGLALRQGAVLALEEVEAQTNGIPGVDLGPERHLALLVCHDTQDDPGTLQRASDVARHLVHTVGVSAVIGPSKTSTRVTEAITEVTSAEGVLTISPSATQMDIPSLEQSGLFWRTVPPDWYHADAWRELGVLLIATLWERRLVIHDQVPRTVYVARADSYGAGLSDLFLENVFKNAPKPRAWSYDLEQPVEWDALAAEIVQAEPQVVFAFSTGEFVTELLPRIERGLSSAQPRPYYLLLDGSRIDELLAVVDERPELAARIVGTAPGLRTSALFTAFRTRFQQAFGEPPGTLAESAYDAAYLLAYAIAGARERHPTGSDLASALRDMSCRDRTPVHAAPDALADDLRAAAEEGCVNFEGASGPLDFDNVRGEAPNHYAVWCPGQESPGKLAFKEMGSDEAPIYYDMQSRHIVGMPKTGVPFCSATPQAAPRLGDTP